MPLKGLPYYLGIVFREKVSLCVTLDTKLICDEHKEFNENSNSTKISSFKGHRVRCTEFGAMVLYASIVRVGEISCKKHGDTTKRCRRMTCGARELIIDALTIYSTIINITTRRCQNMQQYLFYEMSY